MTIEAIARVEFRNCAGSQSGTPAPSADVPPHLPRRHEIILARAVSDFHLAQHPWTLTNLTITNYSSTTTNPNVDTRLSRKDGHDGLILLFDDTIATFYRQKVYFRRLLR
jgi:hypothetical protein